MKNNLIVMPISILLMQKSEAVSLLLGSSMI